MRPCKIDAAAMPGESSEGRMWVLAAGVALYSAYADVPSQTTRSPTLRLRMSPSPTATMVPSASRPRISGLGAG